MTRQNGNPMQQCNTAEQLGWCAGSPFAQNPIS
jgi:hypothetical protein